MFSLIWCWSSRRVASVAGIIHAAEEKDWKTAYSYFFEAFEGYDSIDSPRAITALKYMLLCKIVLNLWVDARCYVSVPASGWWEHYWVHICWLSVSDQRRFSPWSAGNWPCDTPADRQVPTLSFEHLSVMQFVWKKLIFTALWCVFL